MRQITRLFISAALILSWFCAFTQVDKATFKIYEKGKGYFYETIMKDVDARKNDENKPKVYKRFVMDQSDLDLPNKLNLYENYWHSKPISQGFTGTCWCFSTISFYESEIYRIHNKKVKLSEIYTVYWEYIEKAKEFVKTRGKSNFSEGSEANAVSRMFISYGTMPESVYNGLKGNRQFHYHKDMFSEMSNYLTSIKASNSWNEQSVVETIKSILDFHIGTPPDTFEYEGVSYTPTKFLNEYLQLNPNDYIEVLSYLQEPYWEKVEYSVPDNWWHSKEYYNFPLDIYMSILQKAIEQGYTISIGGDVSEPGLSRETQCAMVPSFDIPSDFIDENARQFRFSNKTTTDDHGMHLVGYFTKNGKKWYLLKDSGSGSKNNSKDDPEFGYYFFHEDYIKLKMMNFTVHKDIVKEYLKNFSD